jgi:sulfatase modifying factor 1
MKKIFFWGHLMVYAALSSAQAPLLVDSVNGVVFRMVAVEGGTFSMGCTAEQGDDCFDQEKTIHTVVLSDYHLGETEVTQGLWKAVMGSNPSFYAGKDARPVENVTWNEVQDFLQKLRELTGRPYCLPTEAEWEFAARGGNHSGSFQYSGSDTLAAVAWFDQNSGLRVHRVKTLRPNELGLYDMSGSVWEWCQDVKGEYTPGTFTNPTGPPKGNQRVRRGGSWANSAVYCRVTYRSDEYADHRDGLTGFRLALRRP